jgi:hypothetical protein
MEDEEDTQEENNEETVEQGPPPATPFARPDFTQEQLKEMMMKCGIITNQEGKRVLMVPLEEFKWVICLPHTAETKLYPTENGIEKFVIPRVFEKSRDDWSLHVEIYLEGNLLGPVNKLMIKVDKDGEGFPIIKTEVKG